MPNDGKPDILDALAELPGTAQHNLPAVIDKAKWIPERIVTFRGHSSSLTVELPAHPAGPDPFDDRFREEFASAWQTRDAGLVWELIEKWRIQ